MAIEIWKAIGTSVYSLGMFDEDVEDYEIGLYTSKVVATQAAKGKGRDGKDGKVQRVMAYESLTEKQDLRNKVVAELTPAQRAALNLGEDDEDD